MDVLMPQLGETVAEGKIVKWFKSAGDAVKPGDNLFEIETDKTSMEVPATSAGVLAEIRVVEGSVVPVGAVVAVVSWNGAVVALGPQNATLFGNLIPVTTFVIEIARGYRPGALELAGAALTIAALIASNLFSRRPQQRPAEERAEPAWEPAKAA